MDRAKIPDHDEALAMLAASARAGSVSARIALERALRTQAKQHDELDATLEKLLSPESDLPGT